VPCGRLDDWDYQQILSEARKLDAKVGCQFETRQLSEDRLHEECGVFGVYVKKRTDLADMCYYGLYALQHRGQESAGIAITDGEGIDFYKEMGLVSEVFDRERLECMKKGRLAVGHVRYSTTGSSNVVNAQPLVVKYKKGYLALSHNGNLVNANVLRGQMEEEGAMFQTTNDSEVIASLVARTAHETDLLIAIEKTMDRLMGSYAVALMTEDTLIGIRDPSGIRPLCIGEVDGGYVLASETCALDAVNADFVRDVMPGEIVVIDKNGLRTHSVKGKIKSALCIFEFVYFARTDSTMDGISIYQARYDAGRLLAKAHPAQADLVIGVPDSALTAAMGYAAESGIPYGEGLVKNRYVGRTFIQPDQRMREKGVQIKLNALRKNVAGKRLVLIDDSIVRGTTSKMIVEMLRNAGAKEVHMRISCPPIVSPCFYGIDMSTFDELIAARNIKNPAEGPTEKENEEIASEIGADSLIYQTADNLVKAIGLPRGDLCMACLNGDYPTECGSVMCKIAAENAKNKICKRPFED
jgi:amidophosphoribosyltransferase